MIPSTLITDLATDLRKLSDTLTAIAGQTEPAPSEAKEKTSKKSETKAEPVAEVPVTKAEPKVTIDDVRAVLAELSQAGKTAQVKELLGQFGAAKLSSVKEEDLKALLDAANELK